MYLINRQPTASLHFNIPFTLLFHKTPNYNFLKTFWCALFHFYETLNCPLITPDPFLHTWDLVPLPSDQEAICWKWVFRIRERRWVIQ